MEVEVLQIAPIIINDLTSLLPDEIIVHILSFLSACDIDRFNVVCHWSRNLGSDINLWVKLIEKKIQYKSRICIGIWDCIRQNNGTYLNLNAQYNPNVVPLIENMKEIIFTSPSCIYWSVYKDETFFRMREYNLREYNLFEQIEIGECDCCCDNHCEYCCCDYCTYIGHYCFMVIMANVLIFSCNLNNTNVFVLATLIIIIIVVMMMSIVILSVMRMKFHVKYSLSR